MTDFQIETPPRAWGRHHPGPSGEPRKRNTPTSVGKTRASPPRWSSLRKHPHERGEDGRMLGFRHGIGGNTPTSVGKTSRIMAREARVEKHPHERGEDRSVTPDMARAMETPPRAWGRPANPAMAACIEGNTPTSVGKTCLPRCPARSGQKHPHERGEDRKRS